MTPIHQLCPHFQKEVTTWNWSPVFSALVYHPWHGNELFILLVANSPHKLQEEVPQVTGGRWHYFALCHTVSVSLSLWLLEPFPAALCTKQPWIIHALSKVWWKFSHLLNFQVPKSNINLIQTRLGKYCAICSSMIVSLVYCIIVFKVPGASAC